MTSKAVIAAHEKGLADNAKRDVWQSVTGDVPYDPPKDATPEVKRAYDNTYYDKHTQKPE